MNNCVFDTINIGGTAIPPSPPPRESETCEYDVFPNGFGTILVTFDGDPGPTPLSFVIVDGGNEIRFIRTDLGVASGVAKRQGDAGDED